MDMVMDQAMRQAELVVMPAVQTEIRETKKQRSG